MGRAPGVAAAMLLNLTLLTLPALAAGGPQALAAPALLAFLAAALALQAIELAATRGHDDEPASAPLDARLSALTALLLLAIQVVAVGERAGAGSSSPLAFVGLAPLLAGLLLRRAALRALGPAFVSSPAGRSGAPLHRAGVFAWVRHPSELGLLAFALGAGLLLESRGALALAALALVPLVVWRTRREDRALRDSFGAAHDDYLVAVGGLVPRLRGAVGAPTR